MEPNSRKAEMKAMMFRTRLCLLLVPAWIGVAELAAQDLIPLWPEGKMPNSKGLVLRDSIALRNNP